MVCCTTSKWALALQWLVGIMVFQHSMTVLAASTPVAPTPAFHKQAEKRRKLPGGNYDLLNSVINGMVVPLELEIEPKFIPFTALIFELTLIATIEPEGVCRDLKILDEVLITGNFKRDTEYEILLEAKEVQFECDIFISVEVTNLGDLDISAINTLDRPGKLTFRSTEAELTQAIRAFSPDFQTTPPTRAEPGSCDGDPVSLSYEGESLGEVLGIQLTGLVLDELEGDPTLVFNDVQKELCKLADSLAVEVSNLLVQNALTNTSSEFYISDPFKAGAGEEIMPALELESELYELGLNEIHNLFNLTDRENIFVQALLPVNGTDTETEDNILNTILGFISAIPENSTFDPFLVFLDDTYGLNLTENNGTVVDLDLISIFDGSFFQTEEDPVPVEPVDLVFNFTFNFEDAVTAFLEIEVLKLELDLVPPKNSSILPLLEALGLHTLLLSGLDLNDIVVDGDFRIRLEVENTGSEDNLLLATPFSFELEEIFSPSIDWDGFLAELGILFPLDVDDMMDLQFGPLLENIFDCLISTFIRTPRVSGLSVGHELVQLGLSQFDDAIFVLVADAIEVLIPIYQPIIPRAIELLAADALTGNELLDETICADANETFNDVDLYPYDFSVGIFKNLSDLADEDLLNDLLSTNNAVDEEGIDLLGNTNPFDSNTGGGEFGLNLTLPAFNGYEQDLDLSFTNLRIEGILPPHFNRVTLLQVLNTSVFYPQEIHNLLDIGLPESPIKVIFRFQLLTTEPRYVNPADEGLIPPPPIEMFSQENYVNVELSFDRIDALLDLYLKFSQFDVDSQKIGDFLNIGCWVSRLKYPGGITELNIDLSGIDINIGCNCNNILIEELVAILEDPSTFATFEDFLNDILDRVANLLKGFFEEEEFETTLSTAEQICTNGNLSSISFSEFTAATAKDKYSAVALYLVLFFLAVILPTLMACVLNRFGPKLKKNNQHKANHEHNRKLLDGKLAKDCNFESEGDKFSDAHLRKPMFLNPLIPFWVRIMVPSVLVINLILFIIGDTGDAVQIDVQAHILNVPFRLDAFQTLSVIQSVFELWNGGAYLLAGLLFTLSVAWPYLKLFLLSVCWLSPPGCLRTTVRGTTIELLDILGRFSFAEFHFLVFVLVVFQIEGGSPPLDFLPDDQLFFLRLDILPLVSLFTFSLAIVVSIVISNVLLVYQHNIENETRIQFRAHKLKQLEKTKHAEGLIQHAINEDKYRFRLTNWDFTVHGFDEHAQKMYNYNFSITTFATLLVAGSVFIATSVLVIASTADALEIRIFGLAGYLIDFAGGQSIFKVSVFDLLINVWTAYAGNFTIYFVGFVFIMTIAIIPMMQTVLLALLLFRPVSVAQARRITEVHHVVSVWCCIDVFVLAITLTVLELPVVAGGLVSVIPECEAIGQFMENVLLPMGLVTEEDAQSSCLALESQIGIGAYVAVLAVFFLNTVNFLVSRLFYFYIEDRERFIEADNLVLAQDDESDPSSSSTMPVKGYHKFLRSIGFISIESRKKRALRQKVEAKQFKAIIQAQNPLYESSEADAANVQAVASPGSPSSQAVVPLKPRVLRIRNKEEKKMRETEARKEYDSLMSPKERVRKQLHAFFNRVDPGKVKHIDTLLDEAFNSPDGLYRLNQKLMSKYGATISLDF